MPSVIFHVPDDFYFHERLSADLIFKLCQDMVDEFYTPTYAELSITFNETEYQSRLKIKDLRKPLKEESTEVNSITIKRLLNEPLTIVVYLEGKKSTHSASFTISSNSDALNQKVYQFIKQQLVAIKRELVIAESKTKRAKKEISEQNHAHSFGIQALARQLSKSHTTIRQRQQIYFSPGLIFYRNQVNWTQFAEAVWDDIIAHVNASKLQIHAIRAPLMNLRLKGTKSLGTMLSRENLDNMTFRIGEGSQRNRKNTLSVELSFRKAIDMKKGTRYSLRISVASKVMKLSETIGISVIQGIFFQLEQSRKIEESGILSFDFFQIPRKPSPDRFQYDLTFRKPFRADDWLERLQEITSTNLKKANEEVYFLVDYLQYEYYFLPEMMPQLEEVIKRRGCTKLVWKKRNKNGGFLLIDLDPHPNSDYLVQVLGQFKGNKAGEARVLLDLVQKPPFQAINVQHSLIDSKWLLDPEDEIAPKTEKLETVQVSYPEDRSSIGVHSQRFDFDGKIDKDTLFDFMEKLNQTFFRDQNLLISTNGFDKKDSHLFNIHELDELWDHLRRRGFPENIFASKINPERDFFAITLRFDNHPHGTVSAQSTQDDFDTVLQWVEAYFNKDNIPSNKEKSIPQDQSTISRKESPAGINPDKGKHVACKFIPYLDIKAKDFRNAMARLDFLFGEEETAEALVEMTYGKTHHYQGWEEIKQIGELIQLKKVGSFVIHLKDHGDLVFELQIQLAKYLKTDPNPLDSTFEAVLDDPNKLEQVENLVLDIFANSRKNGFIEYENLIREDSFTIQEAVSARQFNALLEDLFDGFMFVEIFEK
ncbi:MAG: hypothetical protein AAFV80_02640, partial [Bacteroidota bacterium]